MANILAPQHILQRATAHNFHLENQLNLLTIHLYILYQDGLFVILLFFMSKLSNKFINKYEHDPHFDITWGRIAGEKEEE